MRRFCYRCGKLEDREPLVAGLCEKCLKGQKLLHLPKLKLTLCRKCGQVKIGGHWIPDIENAIRELVFSKLEVAKVEGDTLQLVPVQEGSASCNIHVERSRGGFEVNIFARLNLERVIDQKLTVFIPVENTTCAVCRMKSSGYYEAVLQVRGTRDMKKVKEILEMKILEASDEDPRAFASKVEEKKEGLDFYLSSAGLARKLARFLKEVWGAEVMETAKLVGMTGGRRRYRTYILARLED